MVNKLAVTGDLRVEWGWKGGKCGYRRDLYSVELFSIIKYTIVLQNVDHWRKVGKVHTVPLSFPLSLLS